MPLESKAERGFTKWVEDSPHQAVCLKLVLFSLMGFPDRTIMIKPGIIFFIEFKAPGKKQRSQQKIWQRTLQRLGFNYYVCFTKEEAIKIFESEMESS